MHMCVYVLTDASWKLSPKEYGAVVHVYSIHERSETGYKEFHIHAGRRSLRLNSNVIQTALAAAEAHDLGTLGQGNLA